VCEEAKLVMVAEGSRPDVHLCRWSVGQAPHPALSFSFFSGTLPVSQNKAAPLGLGLGLSSSVLGPARGTRWRYSV
jgi:hypothetical protein